MLKKIITFKYYRVREYELLAIKYFDTPCPRARTFTSNPIYKDCFKHLGPPYNDSHTMVTL